MAAVPAPLIARSADGSLVGVHLPPADTSSSKTGMIRCYDGSGVASGSLKFTLRFPLPSVGDSAAGTTNALRKLVFCNGGEGGSPSRLCGILRNSVPIWDLDRGVLAQTLDVRSASAGVRKKKKRGSSSAPGGDEVLRDVTAEGDRLFALVFFPEGGGGGGTAGKCRVYQYDLSAGEAALVKKIKVGSVADASAGSFGVAASRDTVAIRMGGQLRVLDANTGEKLCKIDVPDALRSNNEGGGPGLIQMTPDGKYIVAGAGNQAVLLRLSEEDAEHGLQVAALLSATDESPISNLDVARAGEEGAAVLAFQPAARLASLFAAPNEAVSSGPLVPRMPLARLKADDGASAELSLIHAGFHPRRPDEEVACLFQRSKRRGGSAAGSATHLPMESLTYGGDGLAGTVVVGASLLQEEAGKWGRKRKAAGGAALPPGDQGREASAAADLTLAKKAKAGADGDGEDAAAGREDAFGLEEAGEQGQSIAERLALLSSAMEQTDEEDEEEEKGEKGRPKAEGKFRIKSATSETLAALLTQALSSGDAAQLNVALQVTDRRVVRGTVRALQSLDAARDHDDDGASAPGYLPLLVAHVVRRMARKHSLVMPLGVWIREVLAATARSVADAGSPGTVGRAARDGREMAARLGPLRNFLNERAESFPQLLRLEGRLALLNQRP